MKYCKLTDANDRTYGRTQWGEGVTHRAVGEGKILCTSDVIHVYKHPLLAALFNSSHAAFKNPHLWTCWVRRVVADDGTKVGVKVCTTLKQLPFPEITLAQRVRFAIYCAQLFSQPPAWQKWTENWLARKDRSFEAARAAEWAAVGEATWAEAARAAREAAGAAWEAARAAEWAAARAARISAARAARAARAAAAKAAANAACAVGSGVEIDFLVLLKKAIKEEKDER